MTPNNELNKRIIKNITENEFVLSPKIPRNRFLIELSNICNHKCIFCANKKMTRKKGDINPEFLNRILDEAYNEGVREVGFYTTGEPLASKNLVPAIKQAKQLGYEYIYITTNGALATEEKVIPVIKAGIDSIKFSINAGDEKTYKLIHGKDDFNIVKENLKFVYNYRKDNNLDYKIFISFVITTYTINQVEEFKKEFKPYCDDIIFADMINQGGWNSEKENTLKTNVRNNDILSVTLKLPCMDVFNSLTVTKEGYLTACCVDFENQLAIADLNKMSLKEGWNCDKFQKLRQAHLDKNVRGTICHNCISYSREKFSPINEQLATPIDFDKLYNDEWIQNSIDDFLKERS